MPWPPKLGRRFKIANEAHNVPHVDDPFRLFPSRPFASFVNPALILPCTRRLELRLKQGVSRLQPLGGLKYILPSER